MAKGRFISKEICLDKRVNDLSDSLSILGFTWLITHLDREGRTYGDPAIVKSLIFPRRADITIELVDAYIQEWVDAGLIVLYEAEDDIYIQFPNFDKHQVGLRKDREPASSIPPLTEDCRIIAGKHPAEVNVKLSKVNVNVKGNNSPNFYSEISQTLQIPLMGGKELDYLNELQRQHGDEKLLKIATWLKERDPDINSMFKALRAIDTAAVDWKDLPPGKRQKDSDNRKAILEMLEEK